MAGFAGYGGIEIDADFVSGQPVTGGCRVTSSRSAAVLPVPLSCSLLVDQESRQIAVVIDEDSTPLVSGATRGGR